MSDRPTKAYTVERVCRTVITATVFADSPDDAKRRYLDGDHERTESHTEGRGWGSIRRDRDNDLAPEEVYRARRAQIEGLAGQTITLRWFNRTYSGTVQDIDEQGFRVYEREWGEGIWSSWENDFEVLAVLRTCSACEGVAAAVDERGFCRACASLPGTVIPSGDRP